MSWSTELFCNITFNRETFNSKYEVEDRIEDLDNYIEHCESILKELAVVTEPNKMFNIDEDNNPIDIIRNEVKSTLKELQESYIDRYKLRLLLSNWNNCHNEKGLAISPIDGINWETAFLDGDFIKSTRNLDSDDE